jgi:hypothetical protein
MILTYSSNLFRTETDATIIATALRKGWTEAKMDVTLSAADDPRVADGYPVGYPEAFKPLALNAMAEHTEMTQADLEVLKAIHADALIAYAATIKANYVPWAISNADLRRGLIEIGINPQLITDYLNSLPESAQKWVALADWEYSNYVMRSHPMLDSLAPTFGKTAADLDVLFRSKTEYPKLY